MILRTAMRRIFFFGLAAFLLTACGSEPDPVPTAVPTPPALVQITILPPAAITVTAVPPTKVTPALEPTRQPTNTPTLTPTPAYPLYNGPPLNRNDMGIQLHIQQIDLMPLMDQAQALDVGWVKTQVSWKLYQPYPDQYSA
ncbi:MAG: hypothetical protein GWP17_04270, partial [Aquificales bacterium]|nr:hypothetical protein [Aquificales bacterium]